jgi:hypothetical protein
MRAELGAAGGPPPDSNIRPRRPAPVIVRGAFGFLRHAALAALLAVVVACSGEPANSAVGPGNGGSTGTGGTGGSSGGNVASRIAGSWSHIVYFYDDYGDFRSSQTVWSFSEDGVAVRTVYARNETWGTSDAQVSIARWRVDAGHVEITWQPPFAGTSRYAYRLESSAAFGEVLYLAETPYVPVTQ